ncbi:MAG: hypothetical protein HFJ58_06620 [Clostridia bacterium]|nr:hypothetical protein [Clostridia bacterium]
MNKRVEEFQKRLKDMCRPKQKSERAKEKIYDYGDLKIVENIITGDISICEVEALGYDRTEFRRKIGANDIENGEQVAEYVLQGLLAGRVCFGGYTDKTCNSGKRIYSFLDVWYKIYGKPLEENRKFTKEELLRISREIKEKFKDTKYNYIYSITCKDINNRQNEFEGTKYFGGYLKENEEMQKFEMLDDDSLCVETVGRNEEGNLIIKIGNQEIQTDGYVLGSSTTKSEDSTFEIKLIDSIGISRVFSKAKFTKEACKQIIEDYEKRMDQEER